MNIVIAGAGEVGTHLAKMLSQEEQNIVLIDPNPKRLELAAMRSELLPQVGNPLSPSDLLQANVKYADLFISVMPEEADNILACALASQEKRWHASTTTNSSNPTWHSTSAIWESIP